MKARVLLINPPLAKDQANELDNCFPQGLMHLGTVLKHHQHDVRIIDVDNVYERNRETFSEEEYFQHDLVEAVKDYAPDVVGIGCLFSGSFRTLKLMAKAIKGTFPNMPIVIGGIHPTIFANEMLKKYSFIDIVILAEGEYTFLELIDVLTNTKGSLDAIDGIAFRRNGEVVYNPKSKFIQDLDAMPFVDYSLVDVKAYTMNTANWYSPKKIPVGQPYSIISSRSCPQRCTFCSMWWVHGPKIRNRSPADVVEEMERLHDTYGVRYFEFMDDNFTFDRQRTLDICALIVKRKLDIQFDTPNGVSVRTLDKEVIDALHAAGLRRVSLAIEAGSDYIRNQVMRKGLFTKKIREVVDLCAKHEDLFINSFFILGMPQETHETLEETYQLITSLPLDKFALNYATPYPGTDLFNYCVQHQLITCTTDEQVDNEFLSPRSAEPHYKPHHIDSEDLIKFKEKCFTYLKEKRSKSPLPNNYPFRYVEANGKSHPVETNGKSRQAVEGPPSQVPAGMGA
jgi:anaerobic magnesium-protoporphyrin IX monomethyl ester cyclase